MKTATVATSRFETLVGDLAELVKATAFVAWSSLPRWSDS